jgi:hypothetical protein
LRGKLFNLREKLFLRLLSPTEDARKLVETATLAGAVIGSGKPFKQRRVAVEKNISDQARKCCAEVSAASGGFRTTD